MIDAIELTRRFGRKTAVAQVSFFVETGKVFGYLGHNGAGKTTTVRMLTGQLRPSAGSATVAGYDIVQQRSQLHALIGVVFEHQNLYERLSGRNNLRLFADLFDVDHRRVDDLLELVGLKSRQADKVKKYSNGMRQRLMIARALLNQPRVLFLDEPTRGLDPTSAREIRLVIAELARAGTTVFLTTHYMEEADQLCHEVAFISEGRIIAQDTPRNLKLSYGQECARVVLRDNSEHSIALNRPEDAARLQAWMRDGLVQTIHSQEATLEDIFVQLAGNALK